MSVTPATTFTKDVRKMTMTRRPQTEPLSPYSVTENRNTEELEALNAVTSAAPVDPLRTPDLVAVWTGDLDRFDIDRAHSCAVVIEQTEGGERVLNASPSDERYIMEDLKDLTDEAGGASVAAGPCFDYVGATLGANGIISRLVILGDPEKFNNGEDVHGLSVTGSVFQQRETKPLDAAGAVEKIETLYSAGMFQRARIRILNELGYFHHVSRV